MPRLFRTPAELARSGFIFRIQDNGGATVDRYTVAFSDGDFLALSSDPSHPCGVSLWGERIDPAHMNEQAENGEAVDMAFGDLPREMREHVWSRVNDGWRDFLGAVEAGAAHAVAPSRNEAGRHEGLPGDGGVGIYRSGRLFRVRDGESTGREDSGPFRTFRRALLHTLPQPYDLAGPEYHSPLNVGSMRPTAGVRAKVRALESRVAAVEAGYTVRQLSYGLGPADEWAAVAPDGRCLGTVKSRTGEADAWALAVADLRDNA